MPDQSHGLSHISKEAKMITTSTIVYTWQHTIIRDMDELLFWGWGNYLLKLSIVILGIVDSNGTLQGLIFVKRFNCWPARSFWPSIWRHHKNICKGHSWWPNNEILKHNIWLANTKLVIHHDNSFNIALILEGKALFLMC